MSSRTVQIVGGPERQHAFVDGPTNALLVKVVNPSGGGGGGDVNLAEYGGVAVGATNALHVQPGTGAVFPVSDNGGSLTVDGTVAATQGTSPWVVGDGGGSLTVDGTVTANQGTSPWVVGDGGGSLTVDGTLAVTQSTSPWVVSGTVSAAQSGSWSVGVNNFPAVQPVNDNGGSLTVDGTLAVTQTTSPWVVGQSTHANLNAQVRLQDRDSSGLLSVLEADVTAVFPMTETGVLPLVFVTDDPTATPGDFTYPRMNESGSLYVVLTGGNTQVTQGTTPWTIDGSVTQGSTPWMIDGTVLASQGTSPWVVGDGGGSLTVDGSVSISALVPGTGATNLGKAEDAAHATGDVGVMALAVRNDGGTSLAGASGDYIPLTTDNVGRLRTFSLIGDGANATSNLLGVYGDGDATNIRETGWAPMFEVNPSPSLAGSGIWSRGFMSTTGGLLVSLIESTISLSVGAVVPGTTASSLGKAEDAAHSSGDVGVMALAVRRDTLSSTAGSNNDYATLNTDSVGALWVREYGVTTVVLSGSTRGRPIQITGTTSGGANTLHTATTTSGQLDRIYIWLTNTSTSSVTVTIEFGTTGTGNELNIIVPAKETVLAVDGAVVGGASTDTIKAYAATGSVVNAFGRVERLSA